GGAKRVVSVDISEEAVRLARENAELNGLSDRVEYLCADVFELLPRLLEERAFFDFVILDPPAFTRSRRTARDAARGYKEINYRAMRLLPRGGLLATCSCSHFMPAPLFEEVLKSAADDAGVSLKLIEARRQSPDHPVILGMPESDYLKFYLFQIV
ncbi:MAG: class I SAM-dependent methyltransferase, partial [Clostridia bacterium]|nr:class I SAM-dependent methyltransferase [Clostridia bacterium]